MTQGHRERERGGWSNDTNRGQPGGEPETKKPNASAQKGRVGGKGVARQVVGEIVVPAVVDHLVVFLAVWPVCPSVGPSILPRNSRQPPWEPIGSRGPPGCGFMGSLMSVRISAVSSDHDGSQGFLGPGSTKRPIVPEISSIINGSPRAPKSSRGPFGYITTVIGPHLRSTVRLFSKYPQSLCGPGN